MSADWLYDVNIWILAVGSIVAFLACAAAGQWIGARFRSEESESALSVITSTQAATLGMFAILIGFSFSHGDEPLRAAKSLAPGRGERHRDDGAPRRDAASALRRRANRLLRDYVGVRLSFHRDLDDEAKFAQAIAASTKLHDELWRQASAASALQPLSVPIGLYVQSLNELIDLHAKNLAALRNRVPASSILMLYAIALAGLGLIGYESGLGSVRRSFPTVIVAILLASVILVVVDLDRPRHGLITIGVQPLIDLEASMGAAPKGASDTQ